VTQAETVASEESARMPTLPCVMNRTLAGELWQASQGESWGLTRGEFERILLEVGTAWNYGLSEGETANGKQQAAYFKGVCLPDLMLARACAGGHERAWEHFVAVYRQPLTRAAIAITGSDTLGRELAEQLYAELYGLNLRQDQRHCPLLSYRGRGSLMGWLRTILAQRHVDHHRRTRREEPLEGIDTPAEDPAPETLAGEFLLLKQAVERAVSGRDAEERYLLAAYYFDDQTLLQIARVLGVHEATVSRKLKRAIEGTRKQVLKNLQHSGLSRRAAEELMDAGLNERVGDLDVNLKKLLQNSRAETFKEQAGA
jgi:RNA polymerase sigma-70 factor, ECF subfamily